MPRTVVKAPTASTTRSPTIKGFAPTVTAGATVEPKTGKLHTLNFRTTRDIRERLEAAAWANGRSLAQEGEHRLLESFIREEEAAGGAPRGGGAIRDLARLWQAGFLRGGNLGARVVGHPEWTPEEWLRDPFVFRTAAHAGQDAVLVAEPMELQLEEEDPVRRADLERLWDFYAHKVARGGTVTVVKEGEGKL